MERCSGSNWLDDPSLVFIRHLPSDPEGGRCSGYGGRASKRVRSEPWSKGGLAEGVTRLLIVGEGRITLHGFSGFVVDQTARDKAPLVCLRTRFRSDFVLPA